MRQLLIQVPRGHGANVLDVAGRYDAVNTARWEGEGTDGPLDVVTVHVSNHKFADLLKELQEQPGLRVTLIPRGVIALHPPAEQTPDQVTDVNHRSPVEVFMDALQSIGSWRGFLGYAAAAGVVVWIGLFTNTIYLLVAAMLIAPFAGPAMVTAVGTARGDAYLIGRGLLRYFAGLTTTVVIAALLSLALRQQIATTLMVSVSEISSVASLLALVAGAAGALNLVQSERNSLVSGAAVGMLVAASLAPPAGLVGMASTLSEWGMVQSGAFLLLLQLAGINAAGAVVFRLYGLSAQGVRYPRGQGWVFYAALAATLALLGGLLAWQFAYPPALQRGTVAQRATAEIRQAVRASDLAEAIEVNARFTRADVQGQSSLLVVVYAQRRQGVALSDQDIRQRLTRRIQDRLHAQGFNATPLVSVNVLEAP